MAIYLPELSLDNYSFPSVGEALEEPCGLLAFGGDLHPERILNAYYNGIFPWYGPGEPILWWSPTPRATFNPETFKPSKSVKKFQRKHQYKVTLNHATNEVIRLCSETRSAEECWLNRDMQQAYFTLAENDYVHSVEVWDNDELIGGLYGVQMGQIFCGESMFSLKTNASKIALWYFCHHFSRHQGVMIDCQVLNPHLESLGAIELNADEFYRSLLRLRDNPVVENCYQAQEIQLEVLS
ncbi:leucyl/phenylalanyl-tRNA--protein transferase [Vibrio maerlii]|uniref:leucyl/phenylalanyl-tRNA--protein transferase n=1 Tax=Vibrio maerlii TaxID=2231648 RepID=UPI000E3CF0B9|nr:leucyl/phenylalanyl-tRNA--protein transferase [Vibrio maerlii]